MKGAGKLASIDTLETQAASRQITTRDTPGVFERGAHVSLRLEAHASFVEEPIRRDVVRLLHSIHERRIEPPPQVDAFPELAVDHEMTGSRISLFGLFKVEDRPFLSISEII